MDDSFSYFAYGLHIRADFALWPWAGQGELSRGDPVRIALTQHDLGSSESRFRPGLQEATLTWPGVGTFWVSNGEQVAVRPAPGASTEELALVTGGPVLALLLEQRGHIVLHGSCVDVNGKAMAFLGASGAGKSTLAAALRERGCPLISDGMTVVDASAATPLALPGPPHLKLWPDTIETLSGPPQETFPIARHERKRWYPADSRVPVSSTPLHEVFLLEPGSAEIARVQVGPSAALIGLLENYFLADFADVASREFMLRRCAPLASAVSVSSLRRGSAMSELPALIACVRSQT